MEEQLHVLPNYRLKGDIAAEDGEEDDDKSGLAISLSRGSVLIEVAREEVHATTALKNPGVYDCWPFLLEALQYAQIVIFDHTLQSEWSESVAPVQYVVLPKLCDKHQTHFLVICDDLLQFVSR